MNISDDIKLIYKIMTNMVLFQKSKGDLTLEKSIDIIHWMKEKKCIWLAKKFVGAFIRCYGEKKKKKNLFSNPKIIFMDAKKNEKSQQSV